MLLSQVLRRTSQGRHLKHREKFTTIYGSVPLSDIVVTSAGPPLWSLLIHLRVFWVSVQNDAGPEASGGPTFPFVLELALLRFRLFFVSSPPSDVPSGLGGHTPRLQSDPARRCRGVGPAWGRTSRLSTSGVTWTVTARV